VEEAREKRIRELEEYKRKLIREGAPKIVVEDIDEIIEGYRTGKIPVRAQIFEEGPIRKWLRERETIVPRKKILER
jgi:hypothetical protein